MITIDWVNMMNVITASNMTQYDTLIHDKFLPEFTPAMFPVLISTLASNPLYLCKVARAFK